MPSQLVEDYASQHAYHVPSVVVLSDADEAPGCQQYEEYTYFHYAYQYVKKCKPSPFDPYFQHLSQLDWAIARQTTISGTAFVFTRDADARSYALPLSEVFETAAKECPAINIDPSVMAGAPCIVGTRIPVYGVLDAIEHHGTLDGVLKSYPRLSIDQVKEAVMFAKLVVECPLED